MTPLGRNDSAAWPYDASGNRSPTLADRRSTSDPRLPLQGRSRTYLPPCRLSPPVIGAGHRGRPGSTAGGDQPLGGGMTRPAMTAPDPLVRSQRRKAVVASTIG